VVKKYSKGARAERELAKKLIEMGFAIVRSAGSGGSISIPDLVAIKSGRVLVFECKAWKTTPCLKKDEYKNFLEWCEKAGAVGFLAWKNNNWLFLNIKDIGKKSIRKDGVSFKDLMTVFGV